MLGIVIGFLFARGMGYIYTILKWHIIEDGDCLLKTQDNAK